MYHQAFYSKLLQLWCLWSFLLGKVSCFTSSLACRRPSTVSGISFVSFASTTTDRIVRNRYYQEFFVTASSDEISDSENDDGNNNNKDNGIAIDMADTGFVLLAGGKGSRMKANMPKQFLQLRGVPVLHHSLHLFLEALPDFLLQANKSPPAYVVLVLDPSFQPEYQPIVDRFNGRLAFANPGIERQGSVENGLNKLVEICTANGSNTSCPVRYVAIHDSARPLVTVTEVCYVVRDAKRHGAAVLGVPCKATIKESVDGSMVLRTIPRSRLWEVHTPQVIEITKLQRGFVKVSAEKLDVTDDVSIVEALGEPVKLTLGEYTNLKITTPEDMDVAEAILEERKTSPINMLARVPAY